MNALELEMEVGFVVERLAEALGGEELGGDGAERSSCP